MLIQENETDGSGQAGAVEMTAEQHRAEVRPVRTC